MGNAIEYSDEKLKNVIDALANIDGLSVPKLVARNVVYDAMVDPRFVVDIDIQRLRLIFAETAMREDENVTIPKTANAGKSP